MRNSPPTPFAPAESDRPPHRALPTTARVDPDGVLTLGGVRVTELARHFGTPCYVYDTATIKAACSTVTAALGSRGRAHYAGKAYLAPWLLRYLAQWDMDLDACSATELAIALRADFPPDRIRLHGNNKSDEAMALALENHIGAIVVDNLDELRRLIYLARCAEHPAPVVLRLNPGVEAHTHQYLETGVASSKFGLPLSSGKAREAVELALGHQREVALLGYHAHIGTQVQDADPYVALIRILMQFAQDMFDACGFWPSQLSPGGGPGITYTDEPALPLGVWLGPILAALDHLPAARRPSLHVEPGRSVIGPAGVALYTVGATKRMGGGRTYVLIDGGMADNIRPALYQAVYAALPATRMLDSGPKASVSVAGPFCESGDILIEKAMLPALQSGDLLAVPAAGAYCLPMSSNYNGALRPAVVTVDDGKARLVQRRQTIDDLLVLDVD